MSFFNLQAVNEALKPVSPGDFPSPSDWRREIEIASGCKAGSNLAIARYSVKRQSRIAAVMLGVVTALVLLATTLGSLKSQTMVLTWPAIVIAILLPMALVVGGAFIFYRLGKKIDILARAKIEPFGKRCWAPISIVWKRGEEISLGEADNFVDLSTLDASGSGVALVYMYPSDIENRVPMFVFPLVGVPLFVLGRMIYNLFRALIIPFYITLRIFVEKFCCKDVASEERFTFPDVFRETARSLWGVAKAPFYGAAYYMALFYGLLDPLAGRVALSTLERAWNDSVIRARGFWLMSPQRFFRFEGGGGRYGLGQHAFYSMGCFQPCALLLFKDGEITSGGPTSLKHPHENMSLVIPTITLFRKKREEEEKTSADSTKCDRNLEEA